MSAVLQKAQVRLVALCGRAGSGKSTAAEYLTSAHGFTLVKFASPLKDMLRAIGLTERHIEGDLKESPCDLLQGKTPRLAMQTLGTEWGRNLIGAHLWVSAWRSRVESLLTQGENVVVDDCRFLNEAAVVRALGGVVVMLEGRAVDVGLHSSETFEFEPDFRIENTGSLADLRQAIGDLIQ